MENQVEAHKFFAADCYNKTWDLIKKTDRTEDEDRLMIATAQASFYHWQFREDRTSQNDSISFWQLSRVYALAHAAHEALRYADACWEVSQELEPFYRGYAAEAMVRAKLLDHHTVEAKLWLEKADALAAEVDDAESQGWLKADLDELRARL